MSVESQGWREANERTSSDAVDVPPIARFEHIILIEIGNFGPLRRLVGLRRADLLALDVAELIAAVLPEATVATAGRNLLEVSLATESTAVLEAAIASIRTAVDKSIDIDGAAHRLQLLVGVATATNGKADPVLLVEQAEHALEEARKTRQPVLSPAPAPTLTNEAVLSRELKVAIARDELFLQYQPKLHLRRQAVVSIEALIRWHHPQRGLVMPNDFIPVAERTGDIAAVTMWTLRRAIADYRSLMRNGHDLPVFVNMAGALLSDPTFVDEAVELIENSGARLGIEITETSVIRDPQGAIAHLQRLADIGVVITIDDYGAGLSSLAYLKQLPARELKIDKLFVTQLSSSHRDPLIVRSTIDLAHALEMEVVAEGVETPASLALLAVMGCDMVQGFLISRPLALEALLAFLSDDRHLTLLTEKRSPLERLAAVRARA